MGPRPLTQIYDTAVAPYEMDASLGDPARAWCQHRERFLDRLAELDDAQWAASSRCADWTVRDVVVHLVTTDQFWFVSLQGALTGSPTEILRGFDPSTGTGPVMEPLAELSGQEVLARIVESTALLSATLEGLDEADWSNVGESPLGQVPVRLVVAHALWDSWLHERDVLVALDRPDPVDPDELRLAASYALLMAAVQGGMGDVAGGVDTTLAFDDLPGWPVRLQVGEEFVVAVGDEADAVDSGRAVDVVERYTGRLGDHADETARADVPDVLRPHFLLALDVL